MSSFVRRNSERWLSLLLILLALVGTAVHAADDDDCPCCRSSSIEPAPDWVTYGGIIILLVAVIAMFWALALVCEEYFVPALNVLCEEWKIPDDVAGATFMAAGASSPELFTSFIGLIVYQSNIGVGTVVGSEIFNHMIISAGSVLFAKDGTLYLDARIIWRDLLAYMFSMLVLIYSLKNSVVKALPNTFNESTWDQCLNVTILHGAVLVIVYIAYAAVCGNYQKLTRYFCPRAPVEEEENVEEGTAANGNVNNQPDSQGRPSARASETRGSRASIDPIVTAPYTPRASFREGPLHQWETDEDRVYPTERGSVAAGRNSERQSLVHVKPGRASAGRRTSELARDINAARAQATHQQESTASPRSTFSSPGDMSTMGIELKEGITRSPLTAGVEDPENRDTDVSSASSTTDVTDRVVTEIPVNLIPAGWHWFHLWLLDDLPPEDLPVMQKGSKSLKCYLYMFGDVLKLDALPPWNKWQLRYFTIDANGFYSVASPDEDPTGPHVEIIDLTCAKSMVVTDRDQLKFVINFESDLMPSIEFRAPSPDILEEVHKRIATKITVFAEMDDQKKENFLIAARAKLFEDKTEGHHGHSILEAPKGRYALIWHFIVYPLKFCFHYTLLDCRIEENRKKYPTVILVSVIYLALLSDVMINCCTYIGNLINTTDTIMGLTLSAVGTSFPNLWSSMVVARQGYGSMAISNALGSNVFNINMALGLPWFVYVIILGGNAYKEMPDHGIVLFLILLEIVCVGWVAMIWYNDFKMLAWMSWVYVVVYFVVLISAIALS